MSFPRIEFHPVRSQREFNLIRSSKDVIRFRILTRGDRTTLDADFFSTNWELRRSALRKIHLRWHAEQVTYPCRRGEAGGGRSCIILSVASERETAWKDFLTEILSHGGAWLQWDGRGQFVPLTPTLGEAA